MRCSVVAPGADSCWSDDSCDNKYHCWSQSAGVVIQPITSYDPRTGEILDVDLELNSASFVFSAVDSPACVAPNYSPSCVAWDVHL